ncbi:hypothetical protein ACFL2M_02370, partial [Patescibacteria group bacterium]
MVLRRRILPVAGAVALAALYSGLILRPLEWRGWAIAIGVFVFVSLFFLMKWKWESLDFWYMLFPMAALTIGGTGLLFFLDKPLYQWLFAAILVVVYGVYTENVFIYYYQPQKYTNLSLPNLSFYMNTFASFTLFA